MAIAAGMRKVGAMIIYTLTLITAAYVATVGEFPDRVTCAKAALLVKAAIAEPPVTIVNPVLMCVPKVVMPPNAALDMRIDSWRFEI